MPLTLLGAVPAWHQQANCNGLGDAMFPERGDTAGTAKAKFICARCDVRTECLNDAITRGDEWGVRGGLSGNERRNLRRERNQQPQEVAA